MRFEIAEVDGGIAPEAFRTELYLPRRPAVVRGVAAAWPALASWSLEELTQRLQRCPGSAERQPLWWDIDASLVAGQVRAPAIVEYLLERQRPVLRRRFMRLWLSPGGNRSPWHYDGNSVDVFNVQVTGRKRFTLVSPETPLPTAPFSILARQPMVDPAQMLQPHHVFTQVELTAGDMLFLPRHWFHFVESLEEDNTNLNWVWTDLRSGPRDLPTSRREWELLALLYPLFRAQRALRQVGLRVGPRAVSQFNEAYARDYGGEAEFAVARRERESTPAPRLLRRMATELLTPRGQPFAPPVSAGSVRGQR